MEAKYGIHRDQTETKNGKQFKTEGGISITIWNKKKDKSTMLIDGKEGYLDFTENVLPQIFTLVKERVLVKKRKRLEIPNEETDCDYVQ